MLSYNPHPDISYIKIAYSEDRHIHAKLKLGYFDEPKELNSFLKEEGTQIYSLSITIEEIADQLPPIAKIIAQNTLPALNQLTISQINIKPVGKFPSPSLSNKDAIAFLNALPNLKMLEIHGHGVFGEIQHKKLKELILEGFSITSSFSKKPADLPSLESLIWSYTSDMYGSSLTLNWFGSLFEAEGLPKLTKLDFLGADQDKQLLTNKGFISGKLIAQLTELSLPWLTVKNLKKSVNYIRHLKKLVIGCTMNDTQDSIKKAAPDVPIIFIPTQKRSSIGIGKSWKKMQYFVRGDIDDNNAKELAEVLDSHPDRNDIEKIYFHQIGNVQLEKISPTLAKLPSLSNLDFNDSGDRVGYEGVGDLGAKALCKAFSHNSNLKKLNLKRNPIGVEAIKEIAQLISNSRLEDVDLSLSKNRKDHLTYNALSTLCDAIASTKTLTNLNLYRLRTDISGDKIGSLFGKALAQNCSLKEINLSNLSLGADGVINLSEGLSQNKTLETINISYNKMGADGLKAFAQAVKMHPKLKCVILGRDNDIFGKDAGDALENLLKTVTHFSFDGYESQFSVEDTKHLISSIKNANNLTTLELDNLSYLNLKEEMIVNAVQEWSLHPTLKNISGLYPINLIEKQWNKYIEALTIMPSLSHTIDMGFYVQIELLKRCKRLEGVEETSWENEALPPFFIAAQESSSIKSININETPIDNKSLKHLVKLIETSQTLEKLNVAKCELKSKDVITILKSTAKCKNLKHLTIIDNDLPDGLIIALRNEPQRFGIDYID